MRRTRALTTHLDAMEARLTARLTGILAKLDQLSELIESRRSDDRR